MAIQCHDMALRLKQCAARIVPACLASRGQAIPPGSVFAIDAFCRNGQQAVFATWRASLRLRPETAGTKKSRISRRSTPKLSKARYSRSRLRQQGCQPGGREPSRSADRLDMLTPLLDKNRDGSIIDDVTSMIGRFVNRRN
jgi:hypothetical protein